MGRVAIIGAGNWGTALSIVAARNGHDVRIWSRSPSLVETINREGINNQYLTSFNLPSGIKATNKLEEAILQADILLLAVPSHTIRNIVSQISPYIDQRVILVSASKGIEIETGKRISEIFVELLGNQSLSRFVSLSGPSFAKEVAAGYPTALVAASKDLGTAQVIQTAFSNQSLRIYTNQDLVGVEIGGAVKNVIALASGMIAGLGFGANSIAALVTRGLAEMVRLAITQGAEQETLMGLAGLGDLVLTCTSEQSRNFQVGQELARGKSLDEIIGQMHEVAEGVRTTQAVKLLAEAYKVDIPITNEVFAVLYRRKRVVDAIAQLMMRPLKEEFL
jgi:glycerol-3-phosphate dehydrogenase (NAD(P)+)